MAKIKVLAILNNDDSRYQIKSMLTHEDIAFLGFVRFGETVVEKTMSFMPNVVVIFNDDYEDKSIAVAKELYMSLPGCAIILVSHQVNLAFVEEAMAAGVRKVVDMHCHPSELVQSIQQAYALEKNRNKDVSTAEYMSKVITVFGSKGGIGKSTVASNLAVTLAQRDKRVALLDMDLQFGDINLFFDIDPKDTIAELAQEKQDFNIELIKSYMYPHSSKVSILCAPQSPEMAEIVKGDSLEKIIDTIRPYYDYIIIDSPPYFNDISIIAIESANIILTVITLDIATLRNTKLSLDILDSLQQKDKVEILINRNTSGNINIKDAQNILEYPIKYKISSDWKTSISSLNRGTPLVMDAPRSTISKDFKTMGQMLDGGSRKGRRKK